LCLPLIDTLQHRQFSSMDKVDAAEAQLLKDAKWASLGPGGGQGSERLWPLCLVWRLSCANTPGLMVPRTCMTIEGQNERHAARVEILGQSVQCFVRTRANTQDRVPRNITKPARSKLQLTAICHIASLTKRSSVPLREASYARGCRSSSQLIWSSACLR
jgi:hypothetical protein